MVYDESNFARNWILLLFEHLSKELKTACRFHRTENNTYSLIHASRLLTLGTVAEGYQKVDKDKSMIFLIIQSETFTKGY